MYIDLRELTGWQFNWGRFTFEVDPLCWAIWKRIPALDESYTSYLVLCFGLSVARENE